MIGKRQHPEKPRGCGSVVLTCEVCGGLFRVSPHRLADGKVPRFCGRDCDRMARHRGLVRPRPKTHHGNLAVRPWTAEEDEILRERYLAAGPTALATQLGRSTHAVKHRGQVLGLSRQRVPRWHPWEEAWLRDYLPRRSWKDLAEHLGRTGTAVRIKAKQLHARRWGGGLLTGTEVALAFGVDASTAHGWLERGEMLGEKMAHIGPEGTWQVHPRDVRTFIEEHPAAFDIRKVDQATFLDLVLGRGLRICTRCALGKLASEFHVNHAEEDGLQPWCRDCEIGEVVRLREDQELDEDGTG